MLCHFYKQEIKAQKHTYFVQVSNELHFFLKCSCSFKQTALFLEVFVLIYWPPLTGELTPGSRVGVYSAVLEVGPLADPTRR